MAFNLFSSPIASALPFNRISLLLFGKETEIRWSIRWLDKTVICLLNCRLCVFRERGIRTAEPSVPSDSPPFAHGITEESVWEGEIELV